MSRKKRGKSPAFSILSTLSPLPGRLNQMHRIIGIGTIIIEVCTKGPEANMPQATELDFLNIPRSDPDGTLHIFLQLFISVAAIHISPPLFRAPTGPLETHQDAQAYTNHRHCTQRKRPAMCRHRADPGAEPPYPGHSECPNHPRSSDHAPAHSRSVRLFETSCSLQSVLIVPPA